MMLAATRQYPDAILKWPDNSSPHDCPMTFFSNVLFVARLEAQYFFRHRRLALAAFVVAFVPALYSLIYLSSVWDPEAHIGALPVGLVNLDEGLQYGEHHFDIGRDVVQTLVSQGRFGFRTYKDEQEVRRLVREGDLSFALILPKDFSANAIPGNSAGAGKPVVFLAEGNNLEVAAIARRMAQRLEQDINDRLNEQRWGAVFVNALGSQKRVDALHEGVAELHKGARALSEGSQKTATGSIKLATGSKQLADSTGQMIDSARQLGAALQAIDSQRPSQQDLNRLRNGADALMRGHDSMTAGLAELRTGTQQLSAGVSSLKDATSHSMLAPDELVDGVKQLFDGAKQIEAGVQTGVEQHAKLAEGARQVRNGTFRVTTGLRTMGDAVHEITTKLPTPAQYDALGSGADAVEEGADHAASAVKEVAKGAEQLAIGLAQLEKALPAKVDKPNGSPQGLAHSVKPVLEVVAPVQNSGSGFAPNIIAAALWLGAGVAVFLLHVRVLPVQARTMARPARLAGKIFLPTWMVIAQVFVVCVMTHWVLHIQVLHVLPFILVLSLSALTFLLIVFALARWLGDTGKGIAMVLLALQLSSSGGIMPVELSGRLFADLSPWLPLTWVIKGLKASMFGAFDADWQRPMLIIAAWTLGAALMAIWVGSWRYVEQRDLRPALDI